MQLTRSATLTRNADKGLRRVADPSNVPGRAAAGMLALARPGEEDLHATDEGGMSHASAIGVRGLCDRGACCVRRPPDPARARGGRAGPWLVPAGIVATQLRLGRSSSVAFGRTKTYSLARPAHQAKDAAREPRGRRAVQTKRVFEAPATQTGAPGARSPGAQGRENGAIGGQPSRELPRGRVARLGGAHRGSTDLNWVLVGVERVCRTFVSFVLY